MGMTLQQKINLARKKGFIFDGLRGFITDSNRALLAQDAAMITPPNSGIPAAYNAYLDPVVIEILTAPLNARSILGEAKKGDWNTPYAQFKAIERTGRTAPYGDYSSGAASDVNASFPTREQYVFETVIKYGVREQSASAKAMIDLASEKQLAAASTIDIDGNKFHLLGVAGKEIYGLLNDPNLPPALVAKSINGDTTWDSKSTREIYDDILSIYAEIARNSKGRINQNSNLVLAVSPDSSVNLGKATDLNITVEDMLGKYFKNLEIVSLPELSSDASGNMVMMIARDIGGKPTGQLGFSEKMRALPLVAISSSCFEQKMVGTTYGCILYYPFAAAVMAGV